MSACAAVRVTAAVRPSGRPHTVLEIGAGWGGFGALVKRKLPLTRYLILDIPTVVPLQMWWFHALGHRIASLPRNATRADVASVLCCGGFDILFLEPRQVRERAEARALREELASRRAAARRHTNAQTPPPRAATIAIKASTTAIKQPR